MHTCWEVQSQQQSVLNNYVTSRQSAAARGLNDVWLPARSYLPECSPLIRGITGVAAASKSTVKWWPWLPQHRQHGSGSAGACLEHLAHVHA